MSIAHPAPTRPLKCHKRTTRRPLPNAGNHSERFRRRSPPRLRTHQRHPELCCNHASPHLLLARTRSRDQAAEFEEYEEDAPRTIGFSSSQTAAVRGARASTKLPTGVATLWRGQVAPLTPARRLPAAIKRPTFRNGSELSPRCVAAACAAGRGHAPFFL